MDPVQLGPWCVSSLSFHITGFKPSIARNVDNQTSKNQFYIDHKNRIQLLVTTDFKWIQLHASNESSHIHS